MGVLFAAFGFVSWPSHAIVLGWSEDGIVTSVLGLMALAALTIIVERIGELPPTRVARLRVELPIYMLIYADSFEPSSPRSVKPIAHKG